MKIWVVHGLEGVVFFSYFSYRKNIKLLMVFPLFLLKIMSLKTDIYLLDVCWRTFFVLFDKYTVPINDSDKGTVCLG